MFKLLRYLRPYWIQAILLVVATGVQVWGTLQLPAMMAEIVNRGIASSDTGFIWLSGFKMLGIACVSTAGAFSSSFFSARLGTALARDMRSDIYAKVLSFSIRETEKFSTASLITRTTNDISQVQNTIILILSMMLRTPMMALGAIFQAIATAPDMTWIIALAVVVLLTLATAILAITIPKFELYQKLVDKITLLTRENLTGLRVIRAFNNQKLEQTKFNKVSEKLTLTDIFISKVMSLQTPLMTLIFNGTTLLCVWIGVSHLHSDPAYLGNMMAFMQYAIHVIMSFLFIVVLLIMIPRANVSAKRINAVLATKPKITWQPQTIGMPERAPSVEFRNVDFAYDGAKEKVLHNISFVAKAGETTAFIGSTGSGKSTLINLVPRFHEVTAGKVLVNGVNVKNYAEDDLMHRIGYVAQKGFLFTGDITSNITFGAVNADEAQVKKAAEIAQAQEFINKLEKGYGAHIAEGGTNVSGGQKQRLSIARAIAKNPDIYIFDDSFSALDMKTDAKLRQALKPITDDAVTLIVAQRISTIKDATQIIVLDQGRIVGIGTHRTLLKQCKVYQEIAKSQLSDKEYQKELKA